ncbi:unnamed protein product [Lampetra planeri]
MRGILKRKFAEVDENPCYSSSSFSSSPPSSSLSSPASSEWESDGESSSSDNHDFTPHSPSPPTSLPIVKRPKLARGRSNVCFDQVTVFSFARCQGFTSVPSHGGATLGMVRRHSALQRFTVAEHAAEQRRRRRQVLRDRRIEETAEALKHKFITSGATDQTAASRLTVDHVQDEDTDVHISDADLEDGGFLQPYTSRQRQALLLAAGVKRIDKEEKRQLHALRVSREACGCDCQGFCEPETCACSLAGIKCQVDRFNFPCGCTKDGCGNTQGHVQFDSRRVQTHYIHTVMRLELERRLRDETLGPEDQTGLPEDLDVYEDQGETVAVRSAQDKSCPFGFTCGEDDLPFTVPTSPSFTSIPQQSAAEDNSCCSSSSSSSNMTEPFCSSSDGGCPNRPELHGGLSQLRHTGEALTQHSSSSDTYSTTTDCFQPLTANIFADHLNQTTNYHSENANQANIYDDDSLERFPNTISPTMDYSSAGGYRDLSLSSDSDLEFFDRDYPCSPLHSSFKGHRLPDSFHHLQLFSSVYLPQSESSTYLLESLIGLTELNPEQVYDNQLS